MDLRKHRNLKSIQKTTIKDNRLNYDSLQNSFKKEKSLKQDYTTRYNRYQEKEQIQLPKINEENQSPFKGFIDISVASQKIRKSMATQG